MGGLTLSDILIDHDGPVLTLRLNRPASLNAFSAEMLTGITEALKSAAHDPAVRVVVLAGEGRAFSAGGDVKTMEAATPDVVYEHIEVLIEVVETMTTLEKPIIAAVNGVAVGAGFNLVLASDLVLASQDARFMMSFVHVGLISDGGGLWFLPRMVSPQRAKQLFFFGEPLSAEEAQQWGLVNGVFPLEELKPAALDWANQLAARPRRALAQVKRLANQSLAMSLPDLMRQEQMAQTVLAGTGDHREGVRAFVEKRNPRFTD